MIEGGDLDINFIVNGPGHGALVMDASSSDGLHAIDIKTTGEHEICLDNSFSRFTGNVQTDLPPTICITCGTFVKPGSMCLGLH